MNKLDLTHLMGRLALRSAPHQNKNNDVPVGPMNTRAAQWTQVDASCWANVDRKNLDAPKHHTKHDRETYNHDVPVHPNAKENVSPTDKYEARQRTRAGVLRAKR